MNLTIFVGRMVGTDTIWISGFDNHSHSSLYLTELQAMELVVKLTEHIDAMNLGRLTEAVLDDI